MSHRKTSDLADKITLAKKKIKLSSKYFHYKHKDRYYNIVQIGFIENTEEVCVVYEAEFGDKLVWVRTITDFLSKVKLDDGNEVDRFTKVE